MCCILCLKAATDTDPHIDIFSSDGQLMEMQSVIEKHFWLQPDSTAPAARMICPDCWQSLRTFHEFYLQIVSAHNSMLAEAPLGDDDVMSPVVALEVDHIEVTVKLEDDAEERLTRAATKKNKISKQEANALEDAMPVRRRGRPRKQKLENSNDSGLTQASHKSKAIDQHEEIKVECLQSLEQLMSCDSDDSEANDFSNADALLESECEKPNEESEKKLVTQRSDEYIAQNFKLSCCLCHTALRNFSDLKAHFRNQHNVRGYVLCCGKKLLKRGVLVDHLHTHQNPEYFKCKKCDKVMSDRRCLELHMKGHDDKRERIYQCNVCAKSFYRQSVFRRHVLLHLPDDQKTVSCPQCDKTFATKYIMNQHLKLVHMNAYTKICDICGKSIRGREALQRHQEEHAGVPRAAIQCELCGGTFTTKYGLARHLKMMHTEENLQPHVCDECSKVSPTLSAHKRHMKYVHSMQRKHACPMCDKAFKRMTELREHMTTHTGEVLYTCPHCPKTFNSNANMHSHRKKKHRKEWEERRSQRYGAAPNHKAPQLLLSATSADKLKTNISASFVPKEEN